MRPAKIEVIASIIHDHFNSNYSLAIAREIIASLEDNDYYILINSAPKHMRNEKKPLE